MRNAVFPSFSSELCNMGNNDAQMPNSDVSMQLDGLNVFGRNFRIGSLMDNDHQMGVFTPLSSAEIPPQSHNYPQGFLTTASTSIYENTYQQPIVPNKRFPTPQSAAGFHYIDNLRKRSIGVGGSIDKETVVKESKKNKAVCTEEQFHYRAIEQPSHNQEHRGHVKRSHKLGDRITALQKLVSPYGKTDTASVLQEASVGIKLLQEQIQMLSTPYFRVRPLQPQSFGEKQVDLRSRGLCLVPVSFTQNFTKEDRFDHAILRTAIPRNY
ncbi:hypothetical protein HHK36_016448 [Tetracentron sinense]|uniref:BHLH domain-containing protein n=1 Tax=Tetracentron sinense TaxID=13715 RepID=A0A834Z1C8_TETSI|nr:hypothetical protein HHK36_016448 [Tetracentron sinense]